MSKTTVFLTHQAVEIGEDHSWSDSRLWIGIMVGLILPIIMLFVSRFLSEPSDFAVKAVVFVVAMAVFSHGLREVKWGWLPGREEIEVTDNGPTTFEFGTAIGSTPAIAVPILYGAYVWIPRYVQIGIVGLAFLFVIYQANIFSFRDAWMWLCEKVSDRWYGSKVQVWWEDRPGMSCALLGLVIFLAAAAIWNAALWGIIGMFIGGFIFLLGLYISLFTKAIEEGGL